MAPLLSDNRLVGDQLVVVPGRVLPPPLDLPPEGHGIRVGRPDAAAVGEPGNVHLPVPVEQLQVPGAVLPEQVPAQPGVVPPPGDALWVLVAHPLPSAASLPR